MSSRIVHIIAAALLLGACTPVASPPQRAEAAPPVAPAPATPARMAEAPRLAPPAAPAKPAQEAPKASPPPAAPKASPPPAAAKSSPQPAAPKPATAAPAPAPTPEPPRAATRPALDLKSLEARLKNTGAIGVLTKLSLKNQVDDLIESFLAFHDGKRPPTLTDLRPSYDLLLMKVLSLLQDKDAPLANDINASREAIWSVLTDRQRLAQYK